MKRQSQQIAPLPNIAYNAGGGTINAPAAGSTSTPLDVSPGRDGFSLQVEAPGASSTFAVDGSLDEGKTWVDLSSSMTNLGAADAVITPPIAAAGIYQFPHNFPGMARVRCLVVTGSTPGSAYLSFQDSRVSQ
jgi:hypothetical protein